MSLWFPEPIRITLATDQVVLEHLAYDLKASGFAPRLLRRQVLTTRNSLRSTGWEAALRTLGGELASWDEAGGNVCVVLGNSLVHYALVPNSEQMDAKEEAGVLLHYFQEIYGEAAGQWDLRSSSVSGKSWRPACGVDRALFDALRTLFSQTKTRLRLKSIQPRLMSVCNEHRSAIGSRTAWLLLVEPGNLCLGLVVNGALVHLRNLRIGDNWATELQNLLDRESCLIEPQEDPSEVMLWMREYMAPADFPATSLRLHILQDQHLAVAAVRDVALAIA